MPPQVPLTVSPQRDVKTCSARLEGNHFIIIFFHFRNVTYLNEDYFLPATSVIDHVLTTQLVLAYFLSDVSSISKGDSFI